MLQLDSSHPLILQDQPSLGMTLDMDKGEANKYTRWEGLDMERGGAEEILAVACAIIRRTPAKLILQIIWGWMVLFYWTAIN